MHGIGRGGEDRERTGRGGGVDREREYQSEMTEHRSGVRRGSRRAWVGHGEFLSSDGAADALGAMGHETARLRLRISAGVWGTSRRDRSANRRNFTLAGAPSRRRLADSLIIRGVQSGTAIRDSMAAE